MAFTEVHVVAAKLMVLVLRFQQLALDELIHDIAQFTHRQMSFPAAVLILLELTGIGRLERSLTQWSRSLNRSEALRALCTRPSRASLMAASVWRLGMLGSKGRAFKSSI